jgi:hypothetical protein
MLLILLAIGFTIFLLRQIAHSIRADIKELEEQCSKLDTIKKQHVASEWQNPYK